MAFSASPNGNMAIGNYQEKETYSVYKKQRWITCPHQTPKEEKGLWRFNKDQLQCTYSLKTQQKGERQSRDTAIPATQI